jgi:hypothetical protein
MVADRTRTGGHSEVLTVTRCRCQLEIDIFIPAIAASADTAEAAAWTKAGTGIGTDKRFLSR